MTNPESEPLTKKHEFNIISEDGDYRLLEHVETGEEYLTFDGVRHWLLVQAIEHTNHCENKESCHLYEVVRHLVRVILATQKDMGCNPWDLAYKALP